MDDPIPQALADCLEAIQKGRVSREEALSHFPEFRAQLEPLLETIEQIHSAPAANPRAEFVSGARGHLLQQIGDRKPAAAPAIPRKSAPLPARRVQPFHPGIWLSLLLVVVFMGVMGSGTVYASNQALPGDFLYPVKTQVENLRLQLASNSEAAALEIEFAARRTQEIERLSALGRYDLIPGAAEAMNTALENAQARIDKIPAGQHANVDQLLGQLDQSVKHNISVLSIVLEQVPDNAKDAIQRNIERAEQKHPVQPGQMPTQTVPDIEPSDEPEATQETEPTDEARKTPKPTDGASTPKPTKDKAGSPTKVDTATSAAPATATPAPTATKATGPENKPTNLPGNSQKPTDHPGKKPTDVPVGPPTSKPTKSQAKAPTQAPAVPTPVPPAVIPTQAPANKPATPPGQQNRPTRPPASNPATPNGPGGPNPEPTKTPKPENTHKP